MSTWNKWMWKTQRWIHIKQGKKHVDLLEQILKHKWKKEHSEKHTHTHMPSVPIVFISANGWMCFGYMCENIYVAICLVSDNDSNNDETTGKSLTPLSSLWTRRAETGIIWIESVCVCVCLFVDVVVVARVQHRQVTNIAPGACNERDQRKHFSNKLLVFSCFFRIFLFFCLFLFLSLNRSCPLIFSRLYSPFCLLHYRNTHSLFIILSVCFFFVFIFRAPLSVRGNNGSGGPGSEHSLPPSYNRTRNNLLRIPAIIGGNSNSTGNGSQTRSNDITTSNTSNSIIDAKHSKSSTDIQDIDALFLNANNSSNGSHDTITNESNTKSAEIENATNSESIKIEDEAASKANTTTSSIGSDLVTIVTITGCTTTESSTGGEMNILAHL